jgi:hypothetical protein
LDAVTAEALAARGRALASVELGCDPSGEPSRHRPDLVLWPVEDGAAPVAVEVELTVKASERLERICRAWARARCVAGVLYVASPNAERALARAIERVRGRERIVVLPLAALARERSIPSAA